MRLKDILYRKGIKQVDLVRLTGADPSRISMHINGVRMLPKKYHAVISKKISCTEEELIKMYDKERNGFLK